MCRGGGHAVPPSLRPSSTPGCLGPPVDRGVPSLGIWVLPPHQGFDVNNQGGLLPQHRPRAGIRPISPGWDPPRGRDPPILWPPRHSLECDGVLAAASLAGAHQVAGLPARLQPALRLSSRDGPVVPAVGGDTGRGRSAVAKHWALHPSSPRSPHVDRPHNSRLLLQCQGRVHPLPLAVLGARRLQHLGGPALLA